MGLLFEDSNGAVDPDNPMARDDVLKEMTKEKFATYFEEYRKKKLNGGHDCVDAKSPYVQ
jgi:hypothetical protein